MAVTLVFNFEEGLLRQTGEELHKDIIYNIDLSPAYINQEPTTHQGSQSLPAVTQLQRRESNVADEVIIESQNLYRRRLGNRMTSRQRSRSRDMSKGRSRSNSRRKSRGRSRSRSRGHSRGHSRSRSRGNSRGRSRDRPQGHAKGYSKKQFRNHCRCRKECNLPRNTTLEENRHYSGCHEKCKSI